jgi:hypothetical protein
MRVEQMDKRIIDQANQDAVKEIILQLESDLEYGQKWIIDKITDKFKLERQMVQK